MTLSLRKYPLHYITLHYITLHYITLHYITLHYITLHYITFLSRKLKTWNADPTRPAKIRQNRDPTRPPKIRQNRDPTRPAGPSDPWTNMLNIDFSLQQSHISYHFISSTRWPPYLLVGPPFYCRRQSRSNLLVLLRATTLYRSWSESRPIVGLPLSQCLEC